MLFKCVRFSLLFLFIFLNTGKQTQCSDDIQTKHLPDTNGEYYHYTNLLDTFTCTDLTTHWPTLTDLTHFHC